MNHFYIKDVFNYMGNKFRLLNSIVPEFDKEADLFIDVFGGGGSVFVNQPIDKVVYNDYLMPLYEIMKMFYENKPETCLDCIENLIAEKGITKDSKENFLALRQEWNLKADKDKYSFSGLIMLYVLICHAFNYQLGFNNAGEFNVSCGTNRSSFNKALKERFIPYLQKMQSKDIVSMTNVSFEECIDSMLNNSHYYGNKKLLFYLDPPYLASDDSYSRTKSIKWNKELEKLLYEKCDKINQSGYKFVLSNVLENNGKENIILKEWLSKNNYNIKYIDTDYSNCNYQRNRDTKNVEVLIKNY